MIIALALHVAEVGIIGLGVIVLLTAFKGVTEEHDLGPAFNEALPFTALLVVFFCIVGVIHDQNLFDPIIVYVLAQVLIFRHHYFLLQRCPFNDSDNVLWQQFISTKLKRLLIQA